jgi:glucokinase
LPGFILSEDHTSVMRMNNTVLAVDLGGTNIRVAAVSSEGEVLHLVKRPTLTAVEPSDLVQCLVTMAAECEAAGRERSRSAAIGVGVPANVAPEGPLKHLPNIPTLEGFDLRGELWKALDRRVVLENDATAACIGEAWCGASKGVDNSILVTLGTGVGGGVIVNGLPLRGIDGGAGKIGHICVDPDGHPCGCGSHGCIEQYASAPALVRMATECDLKVESSLELYQAFQRGDTKAVSVFERMGRYLGITLAGLINTLNPEMIVIGGGVAAGLDAFLGPLEKEIQYRAFKEPAMRARIVRSALGDNAGILGAAKSALDALAP